MKFKDLTGQRFGKLLVTAFSHNASYGKKIVRNFPMFSCICDCGGLKTIVSNSLTSGKVNSCGCLLNTLDGKSKSHKREYSSWINAKQRCYSENYNGYHNYGGRGISMCDEWVNNFHQFLADMGERPRGTSLERIDNDKNYSPDNCRWATQVEQSNNQRTNHHLTFRGKTLTIAQWGKELNLKPSLISDRVNICKWDVEKALTTPVQIPLEWRK